LQIESYLVQIVLFYTVTEADNMNFHDTRERRAQRNVDPGALYLEWKVNEKQQYLLNF
jgi:hypothetical protein